MNNVESLTVELSDLVEKMLKKEVSAQEVMTAQKTAGRIVSANMAQLSYDRSHTKDIKFFNNGN